MPTFAKTITRILLIGFFSSFAVQVRPAAAAIFFDDFNDGNINGWTIYDPIGPLVMSSSSYSATLPSMNSVQLAADPSPSLATLGPGRGAIVRTDLPQAGDHVVITDFNNYDTSNQFFGVLARTQQISIGALDAYLLSYSPQWYSTAPRGRFALDRIDNENRFELAEFRFPELDPSGSYQLSLTLVGSQLTGVLTDLATTALPVSIISANDSTYTSGVAGLFVAGSVVNNTASRATFDNFTIAAVPEPGFWAILLVCGLAIPVVRRGCKSKPIQLE